LKEKNILKSGGLDIQQHEDITDTIQTLLAETFDDPQFKNDKEVILGKIFALQGDIRSSKKDLKANLKDFIDLQDQEIVPKELKFFEGFGFDKQLIERCSFVLKYLDSDDCHAYLTQEQCFDDHCDEKSTSSAQQYRLSFVVFSLILSILFVLLI
jgi:hypothetical protein